MDNITELLCKIGKNICGERNKQGLTIEALADKSGIAYQTVVRIENGQTNFKIRSLSQILLALEMNMGDCLELSKSHLVLNDGHEKLRQAQKIFIDTITENLIDALEKYDNYS